MAEELKVGYLGLGTNRGQRAVLLKQAVTNLNRANGVEVSRVSPYYETEPVGPPDQEWYLNAVAEVQVSIPPRALLAVCKDIERAMGRRQGVRWGPRPIDIDILLLGDCHMAGPDLTIPHLQLEMRAFVLVPFAALSPDLLLPSGRTVVEALARLNDAHGVIPYV